MALVEVNVLGLFRANKELLPELEGFSRGVTDGHSFANTSKGHYTVYLTGPGVGEACVHLRTPDKELTYYNNRKLYGWSYVHLRSAWTLFTWVSLLPKVSGFLLYVP